jgi:hypothetical protein
MNYDFKLQEEEEYFSTGKVILFSFLGLIVLLFLYLYFANRALIKSGLHNPRRPKNRKKDQEIWSYGD